MLLVVLTLAGGLLRFYRLDHQSLWTDEIWTWRLSDYPTFRQMLTEGVIPDFHPPAWQAIIYFVLQWVGESEWALRLPAAVAGTLGIPAIYLLGHHLYGRREGLTAAALTAALWFPLVESQEARSYALLFLMTTLSLYSWAKLVDLAAPSSGAGVPPAKDQPGQTKSSPRGQDARATVRLSSFDWNLALYWVCAVILAYLHYFGLYTVLLQAGAAVILGAIRRNPLRDWMRLGALYTLWLLAYSPWLTLFLRHASGYPDIWPRPTPATVLNFYQFLFNRSGWGLALALLVVLTLPLSEWIRMKRRSSSEDRYREPWYRPTPATWFLLGWATLPVLIIYLRSQVATPVFAPRYLLICAPAAYLICARALARLPFPAPARSALAAVLVLGSLVHIIWGMKYYSTPWKEQYREATRYIVARDRANSLVLGGRRAPKHYAYYFERLTGRPRAIIEAWRAQDIPLVDRLINERKPDHIWMIFFLEPPEPPFVAHLSTRMRLLESRSFLGGGIAHFARR